MLLTQADIVFILQATNAPAFLSLDFIRLLDPAHTKIGSTGLEDS